MKEKLIAFLKLLEKVVIPCPRCHHSITYAQYGSDVVGWEDRLVLNIMLRQQFHVLFLDDEDLEKDPVVLVREVLGVLKGMYTKQPEGLEGAEQRLTERRLLE